jgi:hypothetical protein
VQTRGRLRYPADWGSWSREEHIDFRRQRTDMADILEDAAGVVGFGRCLQLLLEPLHALSAGVAQGQPFDWRTAEAALFCVRSVARHCADPRDTQLLDLLRALPQLPATETQLLYTACHVIAQYSPWLAAGGGGGFCHGLAFARARWRWRELLLTRAHLASARPALCCFLCRSAQRAAEPEMLQHLNTHDGVRFLCLSINTPPVPCPALSP